MSVILRSFNDSYQANNNKYQVSARAFFYVCALLLANVLMCILKWKINKNNENQAILHLLPS